MRRGSEWLILLLTAVVVVGCSGDRGEQTDSDGNGGAPAKEVVVAAGAATQDEPDSIAPDADDADLVIFLHADGTVTRESKVGESLSFQQLRETLQAAVKQFNDTRPAGKPTTVAIAGRRPMPGPTIKIVAEPDATHGDLDSLLKNCVGPGREKFRLQSAAGGPSYSFVLLPSAPTAASRDPNQLPPLKIRIAASDDGGVGRILLNSQTRKDMADVQRYLIALGGNNSRPGIPRGSLEIDMHCAADLKLRHVIGALKCIASYTNPDGERVTLIENVRPVSWGSGRAMAVEIMGGEIEEIEEIEEFEVERTDTIDFSEQPVMKIPGTPSRPPEESVLDINLTPPTSFKPAPRNDLFWMNQNLSCRGQDKRAMLCQKWGGNRSSEAAVFGALKWLAAHQNPDGSWNFDFTRGVCQGAAQIRANCETHRAATALALLAFLGANQTHTAGKFQSEVAKGLNYLVRNMKFDGGTCSLEEPGGRMYSHGLGTLAFCEAYALTQDKGMQKPAQFTLDHILYAQDPVGGGWRYVPKQPGDASVTGWQLAALRTGQMAQLVVTADATSGVANFLDSVQYENGARYGYTGPDGTHATTAIGLLSRMYLNASRDHAALQKGIDYLAKLGPSTGPGTDLYFNYFATQVMFQNAVDTSGEKRWTAWNEKLQGDLTEIQADSGHRQGSWFFPDAEGQGAAEGGRLYHTAMAALILEIYYRHPQIYAK